MEDFTAPNDLTKTREHTYGGHTFVLECRDPYGFWYIKPIHKAKMPAILKGVFTGPDKAIEAIEQFAHEIVVPEVKGSSKG